MKKLTFRHVLKVSGEIELDNSIILAAHDVGVDEFISQLCLDSENGGLIVFSNALGDVLGELKITACRAVIRKSQ